MKDGVAASSSRRRLVSGEAGGGSLARTADACARDMPKYDGASTAWAAWAAWAARWWRAGVSEAVSTALLVALGVGSVVLKADGGLINVALCFGCVVACNVAAFGPTSGAHMNPAVTLAAVVAGRLAPGPALLYAAAQAAGALAGFALLAALLPHELGAAVTAPGAGVGGGAAALLEALLTAPLALLCCAAWADHAAGRRDDALPVKFGLTITGLVFAGGPLTGASLNPVRSLAPAIFEGSWAYHWVYWVGPLGGAALGAALHRWVLTAPPPPPPRERAEDLPLRSKEPC